MTPVHALLPSTLNLQDRLSSPSNGNILEVAALDLELNPRGGDEGPRGHGGIGGPAALHGLSSACESDETTGMRPDRWLAMDNGVVEGREPSSTSGLVLTAGRC